MTLKVLYWNEKIYDINFYNSKLTEMW
jgi:hypothetical protein